MEELKRQQVGPADVNCSHEPVNMIPIRSYSKHLANSQARDRKEKFLRSCAEQEAKRQAEEAKAEKRRQAWLLQQQKTAEMQANDDRRNQIRDLQKAEQGRSMADKKKFKEDRISLSMVGLRAALIRDPPAWCGRLPKPRPRRMRVGVGIYLRLRHS